MKLGIWVGAAFPAFRSNLDVREFGPAPGARNRMLGLGSLGIGWSGAAEDHISQHWHSIRSTWLGFPTGSSLTALFFPTIIIK